MRSAPGSTRWHLRSVAVRLQGLILGIGALAAGTSAVPVGHRLICGERTGPGRLVCTLELTAASGRLRWADLIVLEAPEFAPALRDRVGVREATQRTEKQIILPLALMGRRQGQGELVVQARGVWCEPARASRTSGESCVPTSARVVASVRVRASALE